MNVSKYAAHYMLSSDGGFVKWPIVTIREDGMVLKTESFPDGLREQEGILFFSGILCPAFIDFFGANGRDLLNNDKYLLNRHYGDGTLALGISEPSDFLLSRQNFPVVFSHETQFEGFPPLFDPDSPAETLLSRMKSIFLRAGNKDDLETLLKTATLFSARTLGISAAGSLEAGFAPGLLLLEDIDLINLKLTSRTSAKLLNVPDLKYYSR